MILPARLNRRQTLQLLGMSGIGYLLGSCSDDTLAERIGNLTEPLNQPFEELLVKPQQLIPEYPVSAIDSKALIINSAEGNPKLDLDAYRLIIDGEVDHPIRLSLPQLNKLPQASMVIQHVCVEGWAAIVQWGGVRLRDLAMLVKPKPSVRYVIFQSADKYYESWDLASALHPQTLLASSKNGAPLPLDNGAPIRLAAPIKLGYKQSKWVTQVTFSSQIPKGRSGYWEDQGYEWFGGI